MKGRKRAGRRSGRRRPADRRAHPRQSPAGDEERNLASASAVRERLDAMGIKPKRGLGQNFLIDANIVRKIADAAELSVRDTALEIGPGIGGLTQELARRAGRVVAIEVDPDLVDSLRERFEGDERVHIAEADALRTDLSALLPRHEASSPLKVVANLPYYITTPLLFHILESLPFAVAVLMMQREVAERILADPGSKSYGALTVGVQAQCEVEWAGAVSPTVFFPRPEVSSAVLRLLPLKEPAVPAHMRESFRSVVRAAFAHRRKTLKRALTHRAEELGVRTADVSRLLDAAGIDGHRRAESLAVSEFAGLTAGVEALTSSTPSDSPR